MSNSNQKDNEKIIEGLKAVHSLTQETKTYLQATQAQISDNHVDLQELEEMITQLKIEILGNRDTPSLHLRIKALEDWVTHEVEKQNSKELAQKELTNRIMVKTILPWFLALISSALMASGLF